MKLRTLFLTLLSVIFVGLLSILIFRFSYNTSPSSNTYVFPKVKNPKVILFIGDGMGQNHVLNTEMYYDKKMSFSSFDLTGEVKTNSRALFVPTDSAAAATALATGTKVNNKEIAWHNDKNIKNIMEIAKELGLGTGIVTTDNLYGATPASFSSHTSSRNNTEEIIKGQANSNVDILLGAGKKEYSKHERLFLDNDYKVYNDMYINTNNKKIIATFDSVGYQNKGFENSNLSELVKLAVDNLEKNHPNGYVLMVEGAHIDKKSHANDINDMMKYLEDFSATIDYVDKHFKNDENVTLIVTADHETGGLKKAEIKSQINDNLYTRTGHSSKNVNYYIRDNSNRLNELVNKKIDNTDIFKICRALIEP